MSHNRGRDDYEKFRCPSNNGRYPHPESCEYFYECRRGRATLTHCRSGKLYDEKREQCEDKKKVKCHIGGGHHDSSEEHDHHDSSEERKDKGIYD